MKRTQIWVTLLVAISLFSTSCGTGDSIKSLLLTSSGANNNGFYNLPGVDATLQLKVYAVYNSGKMIDVTDASTWTVTPTGYIDSVAPGVPYAPGDALPAYGPDTVPINKTGVMTGIVGICTWTDAIDNSQKPPAPFKPPVWQYTGYYQTTASYRGFTSQPVGIGVGVAASDDFAGCGPS